MLLRFGGPAPVIVVTVLFALGGARSSYLAQREVIHASEERQLTRVATVLRSVIDAEARRTTALAEVFAARESVKSEIRAGGREAVLAETTPVYDTLKGGYGIEGMQFDQLPGSVFLRMHEPEKFGDDVTGRQMVMLAMTGGEAQGGVEVGKSGAKVRGVVQLKDGAGALGAVEIMAGFDPVLATTKAMTGFEVAAYLKQVGEPPAGARMLDGYRELATTDRETILSVFDADSLDGITETMVGRETVGETRYGVMRTPLLDFGGNNIGVIVATRSFADLQSDENAVFRNALVAAIVQIVAVSGVVLLVFNGLLLRPLRRLTAAAEAGEGPDEATLARKDEVGALARALAKGKAS